jgi:hypothetical protein
MNVGSKTMNTNIKTTKNTTPSEQFQNLTGFIWVLWCFQQYFSYIVAVSFIGGGNRRKPPTCRKSLTNFIT